MARRIQMDEFRSKPRPLINIGAGLDIPTSSLVVGTKGETIINGGLSSVVGFTGRGNQFKSTIMHYAMLVALDRMEASLPDMCHAHTYDSEDNMNLNQDRFNSLANIITSYIPKEPIFNDVWTIASKALVTGNEWVKKILYNLYNDKINDKNAKVTYDAFYDNINKKPLELPYPTFIEIDSLSEFEADITMDQLESKDLDKTNTLFMQQGLFKTKLIKDIPRLSNKANIYFLLTAHMGSKIDMSANPYAKPTKDLQYLKQDEKLKGVTEKINFLTTHLWKAFGAAPLVKRELKAPEFPLYKDDVETDLNLVKLQQFRSKTGPSGYVLDIIVSQSEGVIPELTEFYYIKSQKFGLGGNVQNYHLVLKPDVKLSRTTVRRKLKESYELRRAVNILSELKQLSVFKPQLKDLLCSGEELYEDIKALGYDWDIILQTRGWWTIKQYSKDIVPFLSVVDLLKMRKGLYHPYWMEKDKTVKKEYEKHFKTKGENK